MTRVDQQRTNPSKAVSNFKGRWDTVFAWPSTAISTWLNGIGGGDTIWSYVTGDADATVTNGDLIAYSYTSSGTITVTGGYVDLLLLGGGGSGGAGPSSVTTQCYGGGGGAGGLLLLEDVYMAAGVWDISCGGGGSETYIYEDGNISAPLTDARMGSNADVKANFAVAASRGGNGTAVNGGDPGGDHCLNDTQKGSGAGGGAKYSNGQATGGGAAGTAGSSGDIGNNGIAGMANNSGAWPIPYLWAGGAGGGVGGTGSNNDDAGVAGLYSVSGAYTDGGIGVANTHRSAGASTIYIGVGGSAGVSYNSSSVGASRNDNKADGANYQDVGGKSGYGSYEAANYGDANTGSGGGGGYYGSGAGGGGSGLVVFLTRAEDAG